jgi:hypothetical protein
MALNEHELQAEGTNSLAKNNDDGSNGEIRAKSLSPAKLAANRRNGKKSRGPITAEGKARSRWNAVKHGVLSRRLMVFTDGESETFALLLENLRRDLGPANTVEEILVEKIAMAYWRLHIAYGYEAGCARTPDHFLASVDRMGRYATSIHRQLLQDMTQLERIQRLRGGEAVQAPISIDVNVGGVEGLDFCDEKADSSPALETSSGYSNLLAAGSRAATVVGVEAVGENQIQAGADGQLVEFCQTNPTPDAETGDAAGTAEEMK